MSIFTLKTDYTDADGLPSIPADDLNVIMAFIKDLKAVGLILKKTAMGYGSTITLTLDGTTLTFGGDGFTVGIKDGGILSQHISSGAVDSSKCFNTGTNTVSAAIDGNTWNFINGLLDTIV